MIKKLNLGCGRDYREGWENWEISHEVKADRYLDITQGKWPALDKSFGVIYCSGVLEQILINKHLLHVLNECWRVLDHNGELTVIVPNAKFSNAFKDPHDIRQFTEETFKYFDFESQEYKLYGKIYGYKPWEIKSIFTNPQGISSVVLRKHEI